MAFRDILPLYLSENQTWLDLADTMNTVLDPLIKTPTQQLRDRMNINNFHPTNLANKKGIALLDQNDFQYGGQSWVAPKYRAYLAAQLGFNYTNLFALPLLTIEQLIRNTSYYVEGGTPSWSEYLGFLTNTVISAQQCWSSTAEVAKGTWFATAGTNGETIFYLRDNNADFAPYEFSRQNWESFNQLSFTPRTNLIAWSGDVTQTGWSPYISGATITGGFSAPDGTTSAQKLVSNGTNSGILYVGSSNIPLDTPLSVSVWMRADIAQPIVWGIQDGLEETITLTTIWQRYTMTFQPSQLAGAYNTQLTRYFQCYSPGPTGSTWYVWEAQLEESTFSTPLIRTSGSQVTVTDITGSGPTNGQMTFTLAVPLATGEVIYQNDTTSVLATVGASVFSIPELKGVNISAIYRQDWQLNQVLYTSARTNLLSWSQDFSQTAWAQLTGYRNTVLQDAPYAYWPLDETTGTIAGDISGNGFNGTYIAGDTLANAGLLANMVGTKYVNLPGTSSAYVDISLANNFCVGASWTIECWVNVASFMQLSGDSPQGGTNSQPTNTEPTNSLQQTSFGARFLGNTTYVNGTYQSGTDWGISTDGNGNYFFEYWPSIGQGFRIPTTLPTVGTIVHVVLVNNGGIATVYWNGSAQWSGTLNGACVTQALLQIGGQGWSCGAMNGIIGEVAVYSKALSAGRILTHYNTGNSVGSGVSLQSTGIAPDGTTTLQTWQSGSGNTLVETIAGTNGNYALSCFMNAPSTGGATAITLGLQFYNSSSALLETHTLSIDPISGTYINSTASQGITQYSIIVYPNGIAKIQMTIFGNSPTASEIKVFLQWGTSGAVGIWGIQLEEYPIVTSYIKTLSTPVTIVDYVANSINGQVTLYIPPNPGAILTWDGDIIDNGLTTYLYLYPEGNSGIGAPLWENGTWFPTDHYDITIESGVGNSNFSTVQNIENFFQLLTFIVPINVVINNVAFNSQQVTINPLLLSMAGVQTVTWLN